VPDHISLWGSLLKFRREFDQYVNLRPVRLFPGVPCPLAGKQPGDIDFYVVRENTEGEYSALGGHVNPGTEHEVVIQESVFTRRGVDRILRYAFELAQSRPRKTLTSATKSNGLAISMPFWDQRVEAMAQDYPEVKWDKQHIDILCARFVLQPERFDVVVGSNLFGDILSDLGPACTGTIGIAPSANLNPDRTFPSLFEAVHGSAPDIYGKNIANPIATIWAGAMMLDFLGNGDARYQAAHDGILAAIEQTIASGPKTPDMQGSASTQQVGEAICRAIVEQSSPDRRAAPPPGTCSVPLRYPLKNDITDARVPGKGEKTAPQGGIQRRSRKEIGAALRSPPGLSLRSAHRHRCPIRLVRHPWHQLLAWTSGRFQRAPGHRCITRCFSGIS
jgi:tartrate dehydrogenase/decarboxylase/D-malate dehydrogenase